ncbi:MFS transporter [Streptomyces sp. NPDC001698]|uniref:MFS transporter n=1 Tax=Streptomyces sp. NPDC001698 TaxID=3364601 RepID=UPI0036751375
MTSPTTAGRREWLGLCLPVSACLLVSMDMSVLFYAVPFIAEDLKPSNTQLLWIMDSYGFLLAGLLLPMGSLGDRIGRRRLLLIGAAAFGAASVCSAYATTPGTLIAARALLGMAGATLAPSTLALIRNMFRDEKERGSAIALWTAGFALGAMFGPLVAGVLLENFWWGSVFLINLPVMALLLVLGPALLPEYRSGRKEAFDYTGAVLSLAAVLLVVYGTKQLAEGERDTVLALGCVLLGLLVGVLFLYRQHRISAPLVDLTLFRKAGFNAAMAVAAALQFAMLGMTMLTSQYLQLGLGVGPLTAALWRLPAIATLLLGLVAGGILARRTSPAVVVATGLALSAAGLAVMTSVPSGSGLALIVTGGSVVTAGCGMVVPLATTLALGAAPPERAGAASGLSETSSELGGAFGIAALGGPGPAHDQGRAARVTDQRTTPRQTGAAPTSLVTGSMVRNWPKASTWPTSRVKRRIGWVAMIRANNRIVSRRARDRGAVPATSDAHMRRANQDPSGCSPPAHTHSFAPSGTKSSVCSASAAASSSNSPRPSLTAVASRRGPGKGILPGLRMPRAVSDPAYGPQKPQELRTYPSLPGTAESATVTVPERSLWARASMP